MQEYHKKHSEKTYRKLPNGEETFSDQFDITSLFKEFSNLRPYHTGELPSPKFDFKEKPNVYWEFDLNTHIITLSFENAAERDMFAIAFLSKSPRNNIYKYDSFSDHDFFPYFLELYPIDPIYNGG